MRNLWNGNENYWKICRKSIKICERIQVKPDFMDTFQQAGKAMKTTLNFLVWKNTETEEKYKKVVKFFQYFLWGIDVFLNIE